MSDDSASIKVAVRVRPFSAAERAARAACVVSMGGNGTTAISDPALLDLEGDAAISSADFDPSAFRRSFQFDFSFWSHSAGASGGGGGFGSDGGARFSSQRDVFDSLGKSFVVHNALRGYNCAILAYGQTGSGKTYTMMGDGGHSSSGGGGGGGGGSGTAAQPLPLSERADGPGLIPRICDELFGQLAGERVSLGFSIAASSVHASFYEVYNEQVFDLFAKEQQQQQQLSFGGEGAGAGAAAVPAAPPPAASGNPGKSDGRVALRVREHPVEGTFVEGLAALAVSSFVDVARLLEVGGAARVTASTDMNSASSRSHAVFTLILRTMQAPTAAAAAAAEGGGGASAGAAAEDGAPPSSPAAAPALTEKKSKICLVDLAGSERVESSGVTGARLRETAAINKSLSTLSEVIKALAQRDREQSGEEHRQQRRNSSSGGGGTAADGPGTADGAAQASVSSSDGHGVVRTSHLVIVPYRNSVLTRLLREVIGGNSKTVMLAAVSPTDASYRESLATLRYVQRAKQIRVRAVVNTGAEVSPLVAQLRADLHKASTALQAEVEGRAAEAEEALLLIEEWRGRATAAEGAVAGAEASAAEAMAGEKRARRRAAEKTALAVEAEARAAVAIEGAEAAAASLRLARAKEEASAARAAAAEEDAAAARASLSSARFEAEAAVEVLA